MRKSRFFALLTAFALLLTIVFTGVSANASLLYGDADTDGKITVMDATLVQQTLAKITTMTQEQEKLALVSGNDTLTIMDATLIQQYIAKILDKFPCMEDEVTDKETINKIDTNITVHFSNNENWATVYAYIYNEKSGEALAVWPGTALKNSTVNSYGETVYAIDVDCSKYDRIIFSNGTDQTTDTPVTVTSSGYFIQTKLNGKFVTGVYPYNQDNEGTIKYVNLEYSEGYNKQITIWTPVGYDPADTTKKYSVLYMTDGQNLFGDKSTMSGYEWEVDETVLSYMQNGGDGIIVVGIDNSNSKRDSELTPDLGDVVPNYNYGGFKNGTGQAYSDFVVNTVIPYIEANYNTNSIRGIMGSSSGGIEAFYIGMENMDKFSYIGALSPAFLLYDEETWDAYLSTLDFSDKDALPRVYIHNGNSTKDSLEQELYPNAVAMQGWMENRGYPSSLIRTVVDKDGTHSELFWAVWFPEALSFGLGY
ncbi:MAG: starch-binding protein [Ruminococcus sp.]|nr:starch-binding protein [Ruminococcus sp.]